MNKIISSIQWLEAFSLNGVPLADIALLATWLFVLVLSLGVRWPLHPWRRRSERTMSGGN